MKNIKGKIFIKIILSILLIISLDKLIGIGMNYTVSHARNGNIYELNYKLFMAKPGIVILGSSRANHHYNTTLIQEKLKVKTINYGQDGSDVVLWYTFLKIILAHTKPSLVILDIKPNEFNEFNNLNEMSQLYPLANKVRINDEELNIISPFEKWKLMSNCYRFNGIAIEQIVGMFGKKTDTAAISGYSPLPVKKVFMQKKERNEIAFQKRLYNYFLKIIDLCKKNDIKLIVCISPFDDHVIYERSVEETRQACNQTNTPFVNYLNNELVYFPDSLFADVSHLNSAGADIFTKDFLTRLK